VGSGGIWWDLVVESNDSTRSRKLVESVVESFDSTKFPKLPRVAVYRWNSVESTKFYCRAVLGAVEQYRKDQATVYTALDLRCDVSSSEEAVLERTEGLTGL
jgi:hypothetical protein